jgi:hypothetical protein
LIGIEEKGSVAGNQKKQREIAEANIANSTKSNHLASEERTQRERKGVRESRGYERAEIVIKKDQ